jgi:hypothetical protein
MRLLNYKNLHHYTSISEHMVLRYASNGKYCLQKNQRVAVSVKSVPESSVALIMIFFPLICATFSPS